MLGMNLAMALAGAIEAAGFNQRTFAERSGIHRPTLNRIINGKAALSKERAQAILSALPKAQADRLRRDLMDAASAAFSPILVYEATKAKPVLARALLSAKRDATEEEAAELMRVLG